MIELKNLINKSCDTKQNLNYDLMSLLGGPRRSKKSEKKYEYR